MKVLYIGGTGEISQACVLASVSRGHQVTIFNRGQTHSALPEGVELVTGDLRDTDPYSVLAGRYFDVACQFLAYTPETVERDIATFQGRCGQYIFVSTASAYQKLDDGRAITEDRPLENPYWAYSRSKAECEKRLVSEHSFPVTIIRPSHTYRKRVPSTVVPGDHLVWRLRQGKPIIVHDDGKSLWTLTHATDFAEAFVGLIGLEASINTDFHITSDDSPTWRAILEIVAQSLNCKIDIRPVPTARLLGYQPDWEGPLKGDKANSLVFDNSKVKQLLPDWRCVTSLEEGIGSSVQQLLQSAEGIPEPDPALDRLIDQIIADMC